MARLTAGLDDLAALCVRMRAGVCEIETLCVCVCVCVRARARACVWCVWGGCFLPLFLILGLDWGQQARHAMRIQYDVYE